jgi:ribosomal protein S18 acetylase RimI-like enzyme
VDIALARAEDAAAILPLMAAFNEDEGIAWRPEAMGAALHRLLEDSALGLGLVARDRASRSVAGYALATLGFDIEFSGADAFVTELYVAPAFRRRGIAGDLLDALVARLTERGVNAVHLMVRPENEAARALYESRSFRVVPRLLMTRPIVREES